MASIVFFEVGDLEIKYLTEKMAGQDVHFFPEPLTLENIQEANGFEIISPFIYSTLNADVIAKLPNLKCIATRSTGFDHIDLAAAAQKNIAVLNVPFYGENTVAEHAFALLLALSKKIYPSVARTKMGNFSLDGLMGFDLMGKTIGIAGMGHIGQHVARIANGFGINVLAYDTYQDKKIAKKLGFEYVAFEDLLKRSDIISLHLPYNESTNHIINMGNIDLIKKGAYLINTARGGLVDTNALVKALQDGILAGAGLDVMEEEYFIKEELQLLSKEFAKTANLTVMLEDHMLLKMDNVVITPHNAFNSAEGLARILDTTMENIQSFKKGKPINIVIKKP